MCLTSRGIFPYPDLGMLVVAFLSGNLSMCPLPRKDLAPPRPPLGGFSHWNMRCSVFKAHKGQMTACAVMGSSIATGGAAGGVKIVDATDLHTQVRTARHGTVGEPFRQSTTCMASERPGVADELQSTTVLHSVLCCSA